jgi:hypothetical protein
MTPTNPRVQKSCAPFSPVLPPALVLSFLVALAAALASGCGQEGKTIQSVLPVQGLAYDAHPVAIASNTLGDTVVAVMGLNLKIQTTFANGCEARGGLELVTEGPVEQPVYVLTPLARYTADEECNVGLAGDTLQTILINGVRVSMPLIRDGQGRVVTDSVTRFEVRGAGTPPIRFEVNMNVASRGDTATGYFVLVEDRDLATPIDGAIVRVERFGTPEVLGEGTTGPDGRFSFNVACSDSAGANDDPYVVKVTHASRITILTVSLAPSRCKRREQIIVRV